jgi:hypothetical protein
MYFALLRPVPNDAGTTVTDDRRTALRTSSRTCGSDAAKPDAPRWYWPTSPQLVSEPSEQTLPVRVRLVP